MAQILFVGRDIGNVLALATVAQILRETERNKICFALEDGGAASESYSKNDRVFQALRGIEGVISDPAFVNLAVSSADMVIAGMSASERNIGGNMERYAVQKALCANKPVCVLEEVVGGRNNPDWCDLVRHVNIIFTAYVSKNQPKNAMYVGPMSLEPYRQGVSMQELAARGQKKLGIAEGTRVVLYLGIPHSEDPMILYSLYEQLVDLGERTDVTLVLARHGRELKFPIPGFHATYGTVLRELAGNFNIIDASPDHYDLPPEHPAATPLNVTRPNEKPTYAELIASTAIRGAVVGSFNTDVQMVIPYLAPFNIVSIAYLTNGLGAEALFREKGIRVLPQEGLWQATTPKQLHEFLDIALTDSQRRHKHVELMSTLYPYPMRPPTDVMAEEIMKLVKN
jgi:hypothetical protein